jgi:hypothetical protein
VGFATRMGLWIITIGAAVLCCLFSVNVDSYGRFRKSLFMVPGGMMASRGLSWATASHG